MSNSQFVCWKDGIPVTTSRGAWRHALGGKTGGIPPRKRHRPVVISRAEYDRAFHPDTPLAEARAIAERMRAAEAALSDRPYTAEEDGPMRSEPEQAAITAAAAEFPGKGGPEWESARKFLAAQVGPAIDVTDEMVAVTLHGMRNGGTP